MFFLFFFFFFFFFFLSYEINTCKNLSMAALKLFVNGLKLAFIERGISLENLRRYYAASYYFS